MCLPMFIAAIQCRLFSTVAPSPNVCCVIFLRFSYHSKSLSLKYKALSEAIPRIALDYSKLLPNTLSRQIGLNCDRFCRSAFAGLGINTTLALFPSAHLSVHLLKLPLSLSIVCMYSHLHLSSCMSVCLRLKIKERCINVLIARSSNTKGKSNVTTHMQAAFCQKPQLSVISHSFLAKVTASHTLILS